MELVILNRVPERVVGFIAALGAENTELFLSHRSEELRRRLLTALWAGNGLAHAPRKAGSAPSEI
jgi:hypothetical protein